jgi:hypothetical protein
LSCLRQLRLFTTAEFGTTENLLQSMAGALGQAVPKIDRAESDAGRSAR